MTWRGRLSDPIAAPYIQEPAVAAVLVIGSVGRGREIFNYERQPWTETPAG